MRGKLSEQDLTNYALNDGLDARERLYVESMLGASEECRDDVYKMLELSTLLERGFEMESDRTVPRLTRSQREELLNAKPRLQILPFVRKAAATLSLAACVALVAAKSGDWQLGVHTKAVVAATTDATSIVIDGLSSEDSEYINQFVVPQPVDGGDSTLIQASSDGMPMPAVEAICTPPTPKEITLDPATESE